MDGGPALPVAADRVLLVSDITLDATGTPVPASPIERMQGREGALVLVNGQHQPGIPAVPQATRGLVQPVGQPDRELVTGAHPQRGTG